MSKQSEIKEFRTMGRAFASVAFVLWGVLPIHVLGWLVSAVVRNPAADAALREEPVYAFIAHWQGGVNALPPVLLLIFFFMFLFALSFALRRSGYSEAVDGMASARPLVRKLLIPSFLSASAFATGVLSGGTFAKVVASSILLLCFSVVAGMFHYFTDTTQEE